jgi:hypothetical protein
VTDWLKPGSVPPQSASEDLVDDDDAAADDTGGSGEGTDETSNIGGDDQTNWLRDAPGGGDER